MEWLTRGLLWYVSRLGINSRHSFPFLTVYLLLSPWGARGAQLAANALTLPPGSSGIVELSYSSMGDQVTGLQFDVQFDSSALSVLMIPGPVLRSATKNLYGADLASGWHRTLVAGLNQNSMTDGAIVTLFVNVLPGATVGTYGLGITNSLGADSSGNAVTVTGALASITISGQLGEVAAIQSGGILNSASLQPGAVSPGEVVTLIGSGIGPIQPGTLQVLSSRAGEHESLDTP